MAITTSLTSVPPQMRHSESTSEHSGREGDKTSARSDRRKRKQQPLPSSLLRAILPSSPRLFKPTTSISARTRSPTRRHIHRHLLAHPSCWQTESPCVGPTQEARRGATPPSWAIPRTPGVGWEPATETRAAVRVVPVLAATETGGCAAGAGSDLECASSYSCGRMGCLPHHGQRWRRRSGSWKWQRCPRKRESLVCVGLDAHVVDARPMTTSQASAAGGWAACRA
ncbi:uncharacterized protein J3D65DRAFT_308074 [Phyllosticta citribraziliensis]|uniref:Uncharacterized protein n=1 Tax=Phyllosticta citribraziliensis TaxID=989973 RepID=A0ABR1LXZ1_9PEZI